MLVCLTSIEVRGAHAHSAPLRDLYDTYYNAVDRMNQDYHMFFMLRNMHNVHAWGIHSAIFYFLATVRALWEEHRVLYTLAQHGQRAAVSAPIQQHTIPQFIIFCAEALIAEQVVDSDD